MVGHWKALLVVDVQKDFCPGGSLAVSDGDKIVEPINQMVGYAWKNNWHVICSRDWHPAVTKHFKDHGGLWPAHCVQNTPGAEFHPSLKHHAATVIDKGYGKDEDGYSPFDGHTGWGKTLNEYLQSWNVLEIYVCGLATDYCVKAACLDAAKLGYKVYLLLDACRAVNVNLVDGEKAVEEMKTAGVIVTTTNAVLAAENDNTLAVEPGPDGQKKEV